MTAADEVCAEKPWGVSIPVTRCPMVRTMRQPPEYVPRAIAEAAATITHVGTSKPLSGRAP
jgi:hypothetical protein